MLAELNLRCKSQQELDAVLDGYKTLTDEMKRHQIPPRVARKAGAHGRHRAGAQPLNAFLTVENARSNAFSTVVVGGEEALDVDKKLQPWQEALAEMGITQEDDENWTHYSVEEILKRAPGMPEKLINACADKAEHKMHDTAPQGGCMASTPRGTPRLPARARQSDEQLTPSLRFNS
jgi:hypothetical protein